MPSLKSDDFRRAIAFLNEYCVTTRASDYAQRVLEGLHRLLDCDSVGLGEFVRSGDANSTAVTIAPKNFWLPPVESFFAADGLQTHFQWYGPTVGALRLSDVISQQQLHEHPVYREFYRLIGAEDVLFALFDDAECDMFLGATRGSKVSARDRQILDLLIRPIERNLKNVRALTRFERQRELIASALETTCVTHVVVDLQGKIVSEAQSARGLLLNYLKAEPFGDLLPERLLQFAAIQRARLTQLAERSPSSQELRLEREGHRLIVTVAIRSSGYIFSMREENTDPSSGHLLRLGLSKRQAEVLKYVAMGKTNAEIAIILGVSRLTVSKHVENILQCLGVETRTAAATIAIAARARSREVDHGS
jgi:DNA-binding CsgD family transcriptional regulator